MGDNVYPTIVRKDIETKTIKDFAVNEECRTVFIEFTDGTRAEFIYEFPTPYNNKQYESIRLVTYNKNNDITYDG